MSKWTCKLISQTLLYTCFSLQFLGKFRWCNLFIQEVNLNMSSMNRHVKRPNTSLTFNGWFIENYEICTSVGVKDAFPCLTFNLSHIFLFLTCLVCLYNIAWITSTLQYTIRLCTAYLCIQLINNNEQNLEFLFMYMLHKH